MPRDPFKTALLKYLKNADSVCYGKCFELREAIQGWLSYIPQTFPHYTRHTIEHSDEIISQLSQLLFADDNSKKPSVKLSGIEIYILIASAYLHDAGMVVSDTEKANILASDDWKQWATGDGSGAKRWLEVEALRQNKNIKDKTLRDFLADIQIRFLIAEFVRRTHHKNAARILTQHQSSIGRFAFDDPILLRTITDVCVAHGLQQHELLDKDRFPENRTIRGEAVNVRFLSILLRLGDLLDLSFDRACPLLLNAACPIPPDSFAHWSQYQRITHRSTTPDKIEISAECEKQDEHLILQDWCQWLVKEVTNAAGIMAHAARHSDWKPPSVFLDGDTPTIVIKPTKTASYIPSRWAFELDHEAVFERLIRDVDREPNAFLRELIQNALDAMRCKMFLDLQSQKKPVPEFPNHAAEDFRNRYQLLISLEERNIRNPLSGENEKRQFLIVEDCGIGMDREIIQRYFLQVGRSYYVSEEFKRQFRFAPTSRFGVGFLSVFNASNDVVVETFKPNSQSNDGPLRLALKGPRNFLLTEKGSRIDSGTKIQILLQKNLAAGDLTKWVNDLCRRVEFPILVNDLGNKCHVTSENPKQFLYEMVDVTERDAKFVIRAFPVSHPGIEGEIYVLTWLKDGMESWSIATWAKYHYENKHPQAVSPKIPDGLTCIHGMRSGGRILGDNYKSAFSLRIDIRSRSYEPSLSRQIMRHRPTEKGDVEKILEQSLADIVGKHIRVCPRAKGKNGWIYKQRLVELFPLEEFWANVPATVRLYYSKGPRFLSLKKVNSLPIITSVKFSFGQVTAHKLAYAASSKKPLPKNDNKHPMLLHSDLAKISENHVDAIFDSRVPTNIRGLRNDYVAIDWRLKRPGEQPFQQKSGGDTVFIEPFANNDYIAYRFQIRSAKDVILFNSNNVFIKWVILAKEACEQNLHGLESRQFDQLIKLLADAVMYSFTHTKSLLQYLDGWRKISGLPPELHPPDLQNLEGFGDYSITKPSSAK